MSVPPPETSEDFARKEEERLLKSLSRRSGSYTSLSHKKPQPATKKEAPPEPTPQPTPHITNTASRTYLEIEKEQEQKKKQEEKKKTELITHNYVPTWEKVDHGEADSRDGVITDSAVVPESDTASISKKEEDRLGKNISSKIDVPAAEREKRDKRDRASQKLEERMKLHGVVDYSANFV